MEYTTHSVCVRLQLRERVFQRVALMNDAVESGFSGYFQMLPKQFGLLGFVWLVNLVQTILVGRVSRLCAVFDWERGLGSQGTDAPYLKFLAWQTMIVQSRLAERDDLGMSGQLAQRRAQVGGSLVRVGWVPPDHCKHLRN